MYQQIPNMNKSSWLLLCSLEATIATFYFLYSKPFSNSVNCYSRCLHHPILKIITHLVLGFLPLSENIIQKMQSHRRPAVPEDKYSKFQFKLFLCYQGQTFTAAYIPIYYHSYILTLYILGHSFYPSNATAFPLFHFMHRMMDVQVEWYFGNMTKFLFLSEPSFIHFISRFVIHLLIGPIGTSRQIGSFIFLFVVASFNIMYRQELHTLHYNTRS